MELKDESMHKKGKLQLNREDIPQPEKVKMEDLIEAIKTTKKSPGLST